MTNDLEQRVREAAGFDRFANEKAPKEPSNGFWRGVVVGIVGSLLAGLALHAYQMYQLEQAINSYLKAY